MPRLYCEVHGRSADADFCKNQARYRQIAETILCISGKLISGPWLCDRCNATLAAGDTAWLISAFPVWVVDELCDYKFAYERQYFAMKEGDTATAYGAEWPDDSIRKRRTRHP